MVTNRLPAGGRVYAVGDVHGVADRLLTMHERIAADLERRPVAHPLLVHLGDYIDRGPDSAGCLSLLAPRPPIPGVATVNLMGNHEWMLLSALDRPSPDTVGLWLENGGAASLESWGIGRDVPPARWEAEIPPVQLALLRGLALHHRIGDYVFVHAGVRPGTSLAEQRRMDLLWIREEFLDFAGPLLPEAPASCVVHGHTPTVNPEVRPHRIGIDTNAARGGKLTCVVLDDAEPWGQPRFLQV